MSETSDWFTDTSPKVVETVAIAMAAVVGDTVTDIIGGTGGIGMTSPRRRS